MNAQRMKISASLVAASLIGAAAAADKAPDTAPQASIPFVDLGSIYDWKADKRQGLWIQDVHKQWYYARTLAPCLGLDFAVSIAFDTRPGGTFDRFSSIIVPDQGHCQLVSLTRSEPPPKKARKPK